MKNIIFFEGNERDNLLPLTFTKPVSELQMGGLTFNERWKNLLNCKTSNLNQEDYLSKKFPTQIEAENIFINPVFFPNKELIEHIINLKSTNSIFFENSLIAFKGSLNNFQNSNFSNKISIKSPLTYIQYPWDLFTNNCKAIEYDFNLITKNRISEPIPDNVHIIGDKNKIFIEEGAELPLCSLNTQKGNIYIGSNSEIMEGSMIRGSLFLGKNSKIYMGTKIYGGTTIANNCKIGGEINNSIIMKYSNKGHEGFLGNSVISEWCNLGADTNTSNMKNNYAEVCCWNYKQKLLMSTGLQFLGLIMGDHSKSAINTQFNTGTICGVSSNIFCTGFPSNLISHFSWGGSKNSEKYKLDKAFETAEKMMLRRDITFSEQDKYILKYIHENF